MGYMVLDTGFGYYSEAERKARNAFELYENGKMAQALDALEEALEINPANSSWHFNKALTLDAVNRFDDAISEYENALQLNPDDLEILNSLAVDYTRIGQYDLAIDTFRILVFYIQGMLRSFVVIGDCMYRFCLWRL